MDEKRKTNGVFRFAFWIATTGLVILGGAVASNDIRHNGENTEIRKETAIADTEIRKDVAIADTNLRLEVNKEIKEIRKEQQVIRQEVNSTKTDILVAIKGLEVKIENAR